MAQIEHTQMNSGEAKTFRGELKNFDGSYANDNGATYSLKVRTTRDAVGTLISRTAVGTDAGFKDLSILPDDTSAFTYDRRLYYAIRVVESGGQATDLIEGQLLVKVGTAR